MTDEKIILVLEDEIPLQKAIQIKFEKNNIQVATARKVKQALDLLADLERVDAIWLDHYLLGKEDGLDFVAQVKNSNKWKNIPIYVVSNTASPDKIKTYLKFGVEKYYTKSDHRLDEIINEIKLNLD